MKTTAIVLIKKMILITQYRSEKKVMMQIKMIRIDK